MSDATASAGDRLDLRRVARDTLAVTGKRPAFVIGLAFLLAGVPSFFSGTIASHHLHNRFYFLSGQGLLHILALIFVGAFLSASLYRLAIAELEGETPTPAEVFTAAAQIFLPLFAVKLLFALAVALGMILLIVPGLMLAVAWCVAGPALVAERTGITQSFGRSAELTRGNRWRLFGLGLMFLIAVALADSLFSGFGLAVSYGPGGLFSGARLLGSAILSTITTAISAPGIAAVYVQLRELKGR